MRAGHFLSSIPSASSNLLQEAQLVVGVEDREVGLEADALGLLAHQAGGQRMEGAEPPALDRAAEQAGDPLLHLARRLVGEGDREHWPGMALPVISRVGETRGQHPGLAGAGAGQHQDRPVERLHGRALGLVEGGEIGIAQLVAVLRLRRVLGRLGGLGLCHGPYIAQAEPIRRALSGGGCDTRRGGRWTSK